jgi:hypothetical protein
MAEISESDAIDLALLERLPERWSEIRPRLSGAAARIADETRGCGYISGPSAEQLRPTPEESEAFKRLWQWMEDSKHTHFEIV